MSLKQIRGKFRKYVAGKQRVEDPSVSVISAIVRQV